ncbi:MAG TPA: DUF1343 domain-containing protein [Turneriella sp.]|nr:DUF1343 domain-containing protein [Turneriella sp.]
MRYFICCILAFTFVNTVDAKKHFKVRPGLDTLMQKSDKWLKGKRIALIVNHSAVDSKGRHILDLLYPQYKVVKIFAPEHGVRGALDEHVDDEKDTKTGIPIVSLYQRKKKAPTNEDLADVDVLIFDIQEIGLRYYTYASTMVMAMKAAKSAGKTMYILDRPNMAGPLGVYGPLLEKKFHGGFAGYYPIPIAHGMTMGELALYYNKTFDIGANIRVMKMANYRRGMYYDETGLPWKNPSPSIVRMASVIGYHLAGAFETLNISVGRGTDHPFEVYGAPFFDAQKITRELTQAKLPGLKFTPTTFTPTRSAFKGKACHGFKLAITNRRKIQPMRTVITIGRILYKNLPEETRKANWARVANGIGDTAFIERIAKGENYKKLLKLLKKEVHGFIKSRKPYLLYR